MKHILVWGQLFDFQPTTHEHQWSKHISSVRIELKIINLNTDS